MKLAAKDKLNIFIGILLTVMMVCAMLLKFSPLENLEAKLFDYRMEVRGTMTPPGRIVIAALDEKSLEKFGRWPWGRDKIARLVRKLNEDGAAIIMFDFLFSEKGKNDGVLAAAIDDASNVVLPIAFNLDKGHEEKIDPNILRSAFHSITDKDKFAQYPPVSAKGALVPVAPLADKAMAFGHINMLADADGTLRWETTDIEYEGYLFPSIDIQTAALYLGVPPEEISVKATDAVLLGRKRYVPTNKWGQTLINYYGGEHTFPYMSIADILEDTANPKMFQGKIVLVGATAKGIFDLRVTPFSAEMPGIEKHANVIASILDNRFLRRVSPLTNGLVLVVTGLLFSAVLSLFMSRYKDIGAVGVTAASLMLLLFSGYELLVQKGLWVNITYPAMNITLILVAVTSYNYAVEERFARRIRAMFSSYVTEGVVNELIKNPGMARLGGDRREVTVLFSDVRGFTTFSEKHEPEEVVAALNEYLGEMTAVVLKWEGTLDKFIGDAILAFWGAPLKQEKHAELAVKCALDMMRGLKELQYRWESQGKSSFDIGIGINTGEVIVGNIGAEGKKMDYTVIGDHVNLGSRVESLTKKYKGHILITEFTLEKIRDAIEASLIGHVAVKGLEKVIVKGKEKPVGIYEIVPLDPGAESCIIDCDPENIVRMKEK